MSIPDPPLSAATPHAQVKCWGSISNPRYSVAVSDGATQGELAQLVEMAVATFQLVAARLTEARTHGTAPRVHAPDRAVTERVP
jgi:hypothetical protein